MLKFSIDDIIPYSNNFFLSQHIKNVACIKHLHFSAEFVAVTEGELTVTYMDKDINLSCGEGIFILPFHTHGFATKKHSKTAIFTFSLDLIKEFADFLSNREIEKPVFTLSPELITLCRKFDYQKVKNLLYTKSILYPICNEITEKCIFKASAQKMYSTFFKIIDYTVKNFKEDISLESTARIFGLNHKYLSRMFKASSGMCFSDYLNGLRCTHALNIISNPINREKNLSEIAFESGFGSIRNFNRITPIQAKTGIKNKYNT